MNINKELIIKSIYESKEIPTDYFCNDERTPIVEIIEYLKEGLKKGATHIEFSGTSDYESCYSLEDVCFNLVTVEEESDDKFKERIAKIKQAEIDRFKESQSREKEMYLELKRKYESNK